MDGIFRHVNTIPQTENIFFEPAIKLPPEATQAPGIATALGVKHIL